jgi:hypothetical protein
VLIDNFAAFLADYTKDAAGTRLTEDLQRVYADGPTVGIRFAVTADRAGAVPGPWAALTQQKLLFRLADPGDYGNFDVPRNAVPSPVPGRAVVGTTRQVIQVTCRCASRASRWLRTYGGRGRGSGSGVVNRLLYPDPGGWSRHRRRGRAGSRLRVRTRGPDRYRSRTRAPGRHSPARGSSRM